MNRGSRAMIRDDNGRGFSRISSLDGTWGAAFARVEDNRGFQKFFAILATLPYVFFIKLLPCISVLK